MQRCCRRSGRQLAVVSVLLALVSHATAGSVIHVGREPGHTGVSRAGGAGHAMLFRDHVLVKTDFKDFPSTALTFEAWISSSDFCHAGTLMSYAKDSKSTDEAQRVTDFNHFVVFDPRNLLACHDFQYIDLLPDPRNVSCHASFAQRAPRNSRTTAGAVSRDGRWHHVAVTWDAAADGLTSIYLDGLLMASAVTHKTEPLVPDGAFMLGGEQDCFGGCTDPSQGFNGLMDEVRIWRVARTQSDILHTMRQVEGVEGDPDLVAYWKFNEPDMDEGQFRTHVVARDSSAHGNHLTLHAPPLPRPAVLRVPSDRGGPQPPLQTTALQFRNNFALSRAAKGMPGGSFTAEMWVRGAAVNEDDVSQPRSATLLSYATQKVDAAGNPTGFMDDALRVDRVLQDAAPAWLEPLFATSTAGAVVVHLNSGEHTTNEDNRAWMYFDTQWLDDGWHHLAVSWDASSGVVRVLLDGQPAIPFWKSDGGMRDAGSAITGGVDPTLRPDTHRGTEGALVLGQDQDCFGGCFSPSDAFFGEMAVVRLWRRVLPADEVRRNMGKGRPDDVSDLAAMYIFDTSGLKPAEGGGSLAVDRSGNGNHLALRSNAPLFAYSTAPLSLSDGRPVAGPSPGAGGYSLALHDQQVLMLTNFKDFPGTELTLEFWMWSVDTCRPGVPFSYAAGPYEATDNAFLLFNYNSWGVSVMEDEGTLGDHLSGVSATDGNWHHVAVTWRSDTGRVVLYDNGRPMWSVTRGKGKVIPSGGTLVLGREQDCPGGCFDSAAGAAGPTSPMPAQEYGAQDFFGVIEEMRVWRKVRSPEQIRQSMAADDGRGPGGFRSPGVDPGHPDLVAYYKFDAGAGYVVKDVTGHGHDLTITQPPNWVVTRWLSTCGNAVVEGLEECDDGDLTDGDGCSAECTVEPGWVCTGSPSMCRKQQTPPIFPPSGPEPSPSGPQPSGGGGGGDSGGVPQGGGGGGGKAPSAPRPRHSKGWVAVVVITSVLAGLGLTAGAVLAVLHRGQLVQAGAQVASSVGSFSGSLRDGLLSVVPGGDALLRSRQGYAPAGVTDGYDPLAGDHAGVPDFMAVSPVPAQRARAVPGTPGPYQSLVGSPAPPQPPRSNSVV